MEGENKKKKRRKGENTGILSANIIWNRLFFNPVQETSTRDCIYATRMQNGIDL
jgi:hypothetical protein